MYLTYNIPPHFKACEYLAVPKLNTEGGKKQLNLQVSQGSHCHFLHILHLILSTALILSTPLRNSCANEAACGSRGKERKAGRISAKTYEINNTVQPGVLSQQVDTRTLICSHKISTKSGFAAL